MTPDTRPDSREPTASPYPDEMVERFWLRVDRRGLDECWEWQGPRTYGYGYFSASRKVTLRAHRFAYKLLVGPIPDGLGLDHLCRNRACVNPAHLEPVTNRVNTLRGTSPVAVNAQRTRCRRGHPLSGSNLLIERTKRRAPWRVCRTCKLARRTRVA